VRQLFQVLMIVWSALCGVVGLFFAFASFGAGGSSHEAAGVLSAFLAGGVGVVFLAWLSGMVPLAILWHVFRSATPTAERPAEPADARATRRAGRRAATPSGPSARATGGRSSTRPS